MLRLLATGSSELEASRALHYSYAHTRRLAAAACAQLGAKNTRNAIYLATRARLI